MTAADAPRPLDRVWPLRAAAAVAAVVLVVRLWVIIPLFSPTTDEPAHIGAAVAMAEAHKAIATVSHPPLPRWVMAVPLWLDGARLPQCRGMTQVGKEDTGYAWGTAVLYHSATPYNLLLTHVRRVMLIFPLLALFFLYRLTAMLAGERAACFATVFFSVNPTLLGQGFWACSDVAGCAGILAALLYSYRWIDRPTKRRAAVAGVAIGLAISMSFSALFVIPAVAIVALLEVRRSRGTRRLAAALEGYPLDRRPSELGKKCADRDQSLIAGGGSPGLRHANRGFRARLSKITGHIASFPKLSGATAQRGKSPCVHGLVVVIVAAFVALWATYAFNVDTLGNSTVLSSVPQWNRLPRWFLRAPVPMPSFFLGVLRLMAQNHVGVRSYLNGRVSHSGWWYYFLELLAIKSTIGFLLALGAAIGLMIAKGRTNARRTTMMLLVPLGVFAGFAVSARYDLGIRYILPSIALLYAMIGWQLCPTRRAQDGSTDACPSRATAKRGWGLTFLFVLLAAIETAAAHPNYLSFFNVAAGGAAGGQRFALDSNLDWNQDLYRLADYVHARPELGPISLRLTGERNGPLLGALGIDPTALTRSVHGSTLFISKNQRLIGNVLPWLSRYRPVATVGTSIDVYDLRGPARAAEPEDVPAADEPLRK